MSNSGFLESFYGTSLTKSFPTKLHRNQEYPDRPLLAHATELISKLDVLGIPSTPADETDETGDESDGWESKDESTDKDGDVEMQ